MHACFGSGGHGTPRQHLHGRVGAPPPRRCRRRDSFPRSRVARRSACAAIVQLSRTAQLLSSGRCCTSCSRRHTHGWRRSAARQRRRRRVSADGGRNRPQLLLGAGVRASREARGQCHVLARAARRRLVTLLPTLLLRAPPGGRAAAGQRAQPSAAGVRGSQVRVRLTRVQSAAQLTSVRRLHCCRSVDDDDASRGVAPLVSYSLRRLTRGLGSGREARPRTAQRICECTPRQLTQPVCRLVTGRSPRLRARFCWRTGGAAVRRSQGRSGHPARALGARDRQCKGSASTALAQAHTPFPEAPCGCVATFA